MSELAKSNSKPLLETIICDVKTPIKRTVWGNPNQNISNQGEVSLDVEKANQIKNHIRYRRISENQDSLPLYTDLL